MPRVARIPDGEMRELVERLGHEGTPRAYVDSRWLVRELFWRRLEALLALSRPPGCGRAMDLGGGNGVLLPTLAAVYSEVVCVDPRGEIAAEVVASHGLDNVRLERGSLDGAAPETGSFDTIVAADTLEHVRALPELAPRIRRLLRPGGELLVSSPCEGRFYRLGRWLFGYTQPEDHFHDAREVEETLAQTLELTRRRLFPVSASWLGVFSLTRFQAS